MSETKALPAPEDKNKEHKAAFLEYFREVPIQKYAAAHIGRHEDTILDWKRQDSDFSDQIERAKAEYLRRQLKGVRSKEWILERLFKDHFAQRQEHTGKEGGPINFGALTDDQLDQLIQSKLQQIGPGALTGGEAATDAGGPAEVRETTPKAA